MKNSKMTQTELQTNEKVGTTPAPFFRRFVALILDLMIVGILSAFLEIGMAKAFNVSGAKDEYNNSLTKANTFARSTHLLSSSDMIQPSDKGQAKMYEAWLNNQISSEYDKEKDCLYYYYVNFKKDTVENFNKLVSSEQYKGIFTFSNTQPFRLNEEAVKNISKYLEHNDLDKAEVTNTYNKVNTFFNDQYKKAWIDLGKTNNEYIETYKTVETNLKNIKLAVGQSSTVSYVIIAFIYFGLTPFIFKKGRTLGKMLSKIQVKTKEYEEVKWYNVITRGIAQTIIYSITLLYVPIMVLPQFWYQASIISIGNFEFTTVAQSIGSSILILISFILTLAKEEKTSLSDLLSTTLTTDLSPLEIEYKNKKEED